jgi:hypothetical protein
VNSSFHGLFSPVNEFSTLYQSIVEELWRSPPEFVEIERESKSSAMEVALLFSTYGISLRAERLRSIL